MPLQVHNIFKLLFSGFQHVAYNIPYANFCFIPKMVYLVKILCMILWNKCKTCKNIPCWVAHFEHKKSCRTFLLRRSLVPLTQLIWTNILTPNPQVWAFFSFCSALEPSSLAKAIYPVLISYSSPDKQAFPRHTLSRAALIMSESPIFLLDSFTNLIVYYSSTADRSIPFPPPRDCKYMVLHFVVLVLISACML